MRRNLSVYWCELAGTAVMLFIGISAVAFMWAPGSPVPPIANAPLRRLVTGVVFAAGATAVVYSPLGQRSGPDGMMLAHLGPGDWVSETSLLLDEPRSATVVASTGAQLRRIGKEDFGHMLASDPERTHELLRQLARRVRQSSDRLAERI